ncbi:plasmid stabilization protein [Clostridia bacterium]|nr:plasmid stabilization protein [Clostridia bacterium]
MDEQYKVIISTRAKRRMREHIRFLAIVSKPAATRLRVKFNAAFRSLEYMPYRYTVSARQDLESGEYRRLLVSRRYLVSYEIVGGTVYVDDIYDGRQIPGQQKERI